MNNKALIFLSNKLYKQLKKQTKDCFGYVYQLKNKINGKVYDGQCFKLHRRIKGHFKKALIKKNNKCKRFYPAIRKYGKDAWYLSRLRYCNNQKEMDKFEIYDIAKDKATNKNYGYNISEGGRNNRIMKGKNHYLYNHKMKQETKNKISESTSGKNHWSYGIGLSRKHCKAISTGRKGLKFKDNHIKNLIQSHQKFPYKFRKYIKEMHDSGNYSLREISKEINCSPSTVLCISRENI